MPTLPGFPWSGIAVLGLDMLVQNWPVAVLGAFVLLGAVAYAATEQRRFRELTLDYGLFFLFGLFVLAGVYLAVTRGQAFFEETFQQYGLLIVLFVFILEGAMLMYFAPSEVLVPVAIAISQRNGGDIPEFAAIIATSVVGATIGQYVLFLVAKRGGREYLLEKPWFRVGEKQLARFDGWFDRWGPVVVPVSNTLLFTRGMLTVPAGFAEMDDRQFIVFSALGTLSFEILLTLGALGILEFI